jgi:hypothetical protein
MSIEGLPEQERNVAATADTIRLPFVPSDELLSWEFELIGQAPFSWHLQALTLVRVATVVYSLWEQGRAVEEKVFERDPVTGKLKGQGRQVASAEIEAMRYSLVAPHALMLLAFALENETKGILIGKKPSLINGDVATSETTND